jgi:hypothetical protein
MAFVNDILIDNGVCQRHYFRIFDALRKKTRIFIAFLVQILDLLKQGIQKPFPRHSCEGRNQHNMGGSESLSGCQAFASMAKRGGGGESFGTPCGF